jgi:hypothetical protein
VVGKPLTGWNLRSRGCSGSRQPILAGTSIKIEYAADGHQFTVTGVRCGVKRVGSQYFGDKAQGQFCLVKLRVKTSAMSRSSIPKKTRP